MSISNCCFLTCIQISQEAGQVVCYSHLFQNFPHFIVIHTVKGFGIVNEAEINVFLEPSCFFDDPANVGNLVSGSSAFSKTSLNTWKFTIHVLLKPVLENFEHHFTSVWNEYNCVVVWALFGLVFLRDWIKPYKNILKKEVLVKTCEIQEFKHCFQVNCIPVSTFFFFFFDNVLWLCKIWVVVGWLVTVVFDSWKPMDCSPPDSSVHGIS